MEEWILTPDEINQFQNQLFLDEKSQATIEKYIRDINTFSHYVNGMPITKETVIAYKRYLQTRYSVRSINSMLAAVNGFFSFLGKTDLKVKAMKIQQEIFCPEEKELTRAEYTRLCRTAESRRQKKLSLILQTLCATGIRISELKFFTVEMIRQGKIIVNCKSKTRIVFLVNDLKKKLLRYAAEQQIKNGMIFITRTGKPVNRTNVWKEMKMLCDDAHVNPRKVFPHNLRHLFARIFYGIKKDIVALADILGHSSINTSRIYIVSTGTEHRRNMETMKLIL